MKKIIFTSAFLLLTFFAQAQDCNFTFKGTLAGKAVTMCFYPDGNEGEVSGNYYYGTGANGSMNFVGTAIRQADGSYRQKLEEANDEGTVTGYFVGILKKGVMTGSWTSTDGKRSYKYQLTLQK